MKCEFLSCRGSLQSHLVSLGFLIIIYMQLFVKRSRIDVINEVILHMYVIMNTWRTKTNHADICSSSSSGCICCLLPPPIQLCLCWVLPPAQHSSSFFSWKEKKAQSASLVFLLSEFLHLFLVSFCGNWRLVVDQRWTNYMLWKPLHLLLCSASHFTAGTKVQTVCGPVQTWGAEHQIWPMQSIFERVFFFNTWLWNVSDLWILWSQEEVSLDERLG